jgi:hypothetical protein
VKAEVERLQRSIAAARLALVSHGLWQPHTAMAAPLWLSKSTMWKILKMKIPAPGRVCGGSENGWSRPRRDVHPVVAPAAARRTRCGIVSTQK